LKFAYVLYFVKIPTPWALKYNISRYFISRYILRKKINTITADIVEFTTKFSVYKWFRNAALVIGFIDGSCFSLRFSYDSASNFNHFFFFLLPFLFYAYFSTAVLEAHVKGNTGQKLKELSIIFVMFVFLNMYVHLSKFSNEKYQNIVLSRSPPWYPFDCGLAIAS